MILDFNFSRQKFLDFFWVVHPAFMICDIQWSMINDLSEPYLAFANLFLVLESISCSETVGTRLINLHIWYSATLNDF